MKPHRFHSEHRTLNTILLACIIGAAAGLVAAFFIALASVTFHAFGWFGLFVLFTFVAALGLFFIHTERHHGR